jgi:DNA-binding response OmpR family regulator
MIGETQRGSPLRVLVVDDDVDMADSVVVLLGLEGHQARQALDGESAVRSAQDELPDVVLLELGLPGMDGCEVARRVRELDGGDKVLIIAVSGCNLVRQIHCNAWAAGIYIALKKPVEPELLLAILAQYRQRLRDTTGLDADGSTSRVERCRARAD